MRYLVLVLWLLGATAAWSAERPLIVGVEEQNYLPNYAWVDGSFQGAGAEILAAFAADRGYQVQFHPLPIRRLYAEVLAGTVDLKFPDSPEWALDAKAGHTLTYSTPVLDYVDGVLVKASAVGMGIDNVHSLSTVSGFTLPVEWRNRIKDGAVALKESTRMDQVLRLVLLDRVDGAYISIASALYLADHVMEQKGALALDPNLPLRRGSYQASSVLHPEIIQDLNTWMAEHHDQIKVIKAHWGVEN